MEHVSFYSDEKAKRGLALSDYLCARLAEHHGLTIPDYIQPTVPDLAVVAPPSLVDTTTWGKRVCIRVPAEHRAVYDERAKAAESSLSEYVRDALAAAHHLGPVPAHRVEEPDLLSA